MTIFTDFKNTNQDIEIIKNLTRIMALDVGTKRIGIAISDHSKFLATPKLIINRQSNHKDFEKVKDFIEENQVSAIVVGLPYNMNGSSGNMVEFIENFTKNLDNFLENKLPIFFFDERLSSFEAREIAASDLSRKKNPHYDDIAASIILQGFLDVISEQK